MPVATTTNKQATLIDFASILTLEKALHQSGKHLPKVGMPAKDWLSLGQPLDDWIEIAATHLANAIVASCSLIDFEATVIDGAFPKEISQHKNPV